MSAVDTERREALEAAGAGAGAGHGEAGEAGSRAADESSAVVKRRYVRRMFSEIAPTYDLLNRLLSFNIDGRWRRRAIDVLGWERHPRGMFLDACAGTLDMSVELSRRAGFAGTIVAADFAEAMLRAGRTKVRGGAVRPVVADALQLPLGDGSVDGAMVAFGVRNFADIDAGLRELARVLKPGARLVVLDCSSPPSRLVRGVYQVYFRQLLPLVGRVVSGHRTAYRYLPESVAHFPPAPALKARLERAGLARVTYDTLTLGVTAVHWGERPGVDGAAA
ncbi:MAG TPA: ubiquinone/menaquinone biosynthesis methyltransferase [Gemmatimonadaceae bacterium]|nr:ubiquinone/menaquinone biosynthesis methyltransferase [Gemmatimonadaceae bacterium]